MIIPCLDEEATVAAAVEEVLAHTPALPMPVQLILIDDGSRDRTGAVMRELVARYPACELIVNPHNLGLGRSVMNAYERIPDRSWVTVFPGDREIVFAPSIDSFMAARERHDVILGYLQNPVIRTVTRRLASWAYTKVTSTLYGFGWRYLNGMKMYRVDAFRGIEVRSSGHAYIAELLAKAQLRNPALRIGEAPFVARGRKSGDSRAFTLRSIARAVQEVHKGGRAVASWREELVRSGALAPPPPVPAPAPTTARREPVAPMPPAARRAPDERPTEPADRPTAPHEGRPAARELPLP